MFGVGRASSAPGHFSGRPAPTLLLFKIIPNGRSSDGANMHVKWGLAGGMDHPLCDNGRELCFCLGSEPGSKLAVKNSLEFYYVLMERIS